MRVVISASPVSTRRERFKSRMASIVCRCFADETPFGDVRSKIGSPPLRNGTPWYVVGKKPLPQLTAPPRGPRGPDCNTTKPGESCDSLPNPYVTHEPMLGRPNCPEPVFMNNLAGA